LPIKHVYQVLIQDLIKLFTFSCIIISSICNNEDLIEMALTRHALRYPIRSLWYCYVRLVETFLRTRSRTPVCRNEQHKYNRKKKMNIFWNRHRTHISSEHTKDDRISRSRDTSEGSDDSHPNLPILFNNRVARCWAMCSLELRKRRTTVSAWAAQYISSQFLVAATLHVLIKTCLCNPMKICVGNCYFPIRHVYQILIRIWLNYLLLLYHSQPDFVIEDLILRDGLNLKITRSGPYDMSGHFLRPSQVIFEEEQVKVNK